jgi:hypothetical protein
MAAAVPLAARVKRREDVRVTVVNAQERFTERMRLHMTATGQRLAELSAPSRTAPPTTSERGERQRGAARTSVPGPDDGFRHLTAR